MMGGVVSSFFSFHTSCNLGGIGWHGRSVHEYMGMSGSLIRFADRDSDGIAWCSILWAPVLYRTGCEYHNVDSLNYELEYHLAFNVVTVFIVSVHP